MSGDNWAGRRLSAAASYDEHCSAWLCDQHKFGVNRRIGHQNIPGVGWGLAICTKQETRDALAPTSPGVAA